MSLDKKDIESRVVDVLKTIFDPEIPVDIYELGLIYEVKVNDSAFVHILMTLTSPSCPVAETLACRGGGKSGWNKGCRRG